MIETQRIEEKQGAGTQVGMFFSASGPLLDFSVDNEEKGRIGLAPTPEKTTRPCSLSFPSLLYYMRRTNWLHCWCTPTHCLLAQMEC